MRLKIYVILLKVLILNYSKLKKQFNKGEAQDEQERHTAIQHVLDKKYQVELKHIMKPIGKDKKFADLRAAQLEEELAQLKNEVVLHKDQVNVLVGVISSRDQRLARCLELAEKRAAELEGELEWEGEGEGEDE